MRPEPTYRVPADKADFVIVTALPEERDAVLAKVDRPLQLEPHNNDPNIYYSATVPINPPSAAEHKAIILSLPGTGRVHAALATTDAIRRWQPECVLLVGIAGGLPRENNAALLGDILVADEIIDYELQKRYPDEIEYRDKRPPVSQRLLTAAQNFAADWSGLISEPRPSPGRPTCLFGPVASGDKVMNDPAFVAELQKRFPRLIGVEMEAGGAASAALRSETNFFMVRGVSDLAQGKDDPEVRRWRRYACDVAAAYTTGLLRSGLIPAADNSDIKLDYSTISNVVRATLSATRMLDRVGDGVATALTDQPLPTHAREHRFVIEGGGIELVARKDGLVEKTITGQDFGKLQPEMLRYIMVLEKSMENHFRVWEEVRPQLAEMVDPVAKARVKQQLRSIAEDMKGDLLGILEFLEDCGFYLDDHYIYIRKVIKKPV